MDNDPTNDGTPAEEEQEVSEQSGVEPFDDTNLDNFLHPEDQTKSWFRHLHSNTDYKTGNIGRQIRGFTERHGFASEEEARKFFMDVYQGKRGQGRNYRQRFKTALKEHHMADGTPPRGMVVAHLPLRTAHGSSTTAGTTSCRGHQHRTAAC